MNYEDFEKNNVFFAEEERDKKIKKELRKLRRITRELPDDQRKLCQTLIENLAYTSVQLEELKEIIKRDGYFDIYKNGKNQWGTKQSAASSVYNNTLKIYNTTLKQFRELVPETIGGNDPLKQFAEKHNKKENDNQ